MTKAIPPKHIVLYADDDQDDLMLLQEAFSNYALNVKVVTARDGNEALEYLNSLTPLDPSPCLIILDVNMPRMDGKETLWNIRKHHRFVEIPVVMFTTSSFLADRDFAEKYKAGFITKPLDTKQLAAIADQFIEYCTDDIKKSIVKN